MNMTKTHSPVGIRTLSLLFFNTNSKLWLTIPWYLKHRTRHTMKLLDHHNPQTVHSGLTCGKHGHFETQFSQLF